ncbi:hypothetical protein DIE14_22340 [Burkholderia sp. Bp9017]|nr:hypothetical protein DIE14_22340 [Burkholderia sp. Bp9017]RQZ32213.1 hypothetical protein DIE13_22215 [Burkholderia sp. Bp9016]
MRRPTAAVSGHSTRARPAAAVRPAATLLHRCRPTASDISPERETSNASSAYTAVIPPDETRR